MRIITNIDSSALRKNPAAIASVARGFLQGLITYDRLLLRMGAVPKLGDSSVIFKREPWAGRWDEFADALTCMKRGWGDCEDLVAWRVAELQEAGELAANVKIYWRELPNGEADIYHAEVRRADGRVEDPARERGMAPSRVG